MGETLALLRTGSWNHGHQQIYKNIQHFTK